MAGVAFPSDTKAGLELGRAVAARVIEQMKIDGAKKWSGAVPTGPGLWKGTNPVGVDEVGWKLFVLNSPSQFRPGPPPAHDSPERAAELAEVKSFKRTPFTNSKVSYWQFGQLGQPAVTFRLSEEIGRRLAEDGAHASAPRAARAYALVYVAYYEGWIASQDAKFITGPHVRIIRRGVDHGDSDSAIPDVSRQCGHARESAGGGLSYLFFARARAVRRVGAGIRGIAPMGGHPFPQRPYIRWEIGRQVARRVVARAKADGA